ncbi:MAG: cupredoxin domain-containing protein [Thaumarchaeota archaeon]|nr:cupredoxin domain-containing protein [Nitrososphaerota archaeon]
MNLKPLAGLTIFVLLFGIASHSLVNSAFAQYAKDTKDKALADAKAAKDKALADAKAAKDKAAAAAKAAKDKALADAKAAKDKALADAKAAKDKAKAESKETGAKSLGTIGSGITVSIAKGASTPGCDKTSTCYTPNQAKVKAGGKVTWKNDDTASHTVTSGKDATADGVFDSGLFASGKTFSFKFDKAGTFNYYCQVHPWMKGSVIVS